MTENDEKLADCVNKRDETAKELLTKFSKLCDLNNNPMTQAERNCYRWGAEKGWDAGIEHERARSQKLVEAMKQFPCMYYDSNDNQVEHAEHCEKCKVINEYEGEAK